MKKVIIYGSHYGTTRRYAEKLSELTGIEAINYSDVKNLSGYETVIHMGGLYAGGVKGLKNTVKLLADSTRLIVVTVGLADVTKKENTDHIKKSVGMQLPQSVLERTTILHLRGAMDYSKLNIAHKSMMALVYKKTKSTPDEEKTEEVKDMIATYGQKADFMDFSSLEKVMEKL